MHIKFSEIEKLFPENIQKPAFRKNMLKERLLEATKNTNFESKMNDCRHLVWDDSELNKIKFFRQYIDQYDFD